MVRRNDQREKTMKTLITITAAIALSSVSVGATLFVTTPVSAEAQAIADAQYDAVYEESYDAAFDDAFNAQLAKQTAAYEAKKNPAL
jgi:multisubunit Na+/H+ antiporter MnhG subunit